MTIPSAREIAALSFDEAISAADDPDACAPWRDDFSASADWIGREDVAVPRGPALESICEGYGFPDVARAQLVAHRDDHDAPHIRRLGAHVQWMIEERYSPGGYARLGWPTFDRTAPLFHAHAALGLVRRVALRQAAAGIDPAITRATLRDIGQQVMLHDRVHGQAGMKKGWWLSHHLSDHLFRLGRLQFQRARLPNGPGPIGPDEPYLDVHIPEDGPLDPEACDAAFARSRDFFARHFPDEAPRFFACSSWLLDPTLAELLGEGSNIVRFQRRFRLDRLREGRSNVFEFVFDRPDLDAAEAPVVSGLPRDSRLRAAIVDLYAGGGRIRVGVGTARIA